MALAYKHRWHTDTATSGSDIPVQTTASEAQSRGRAGMALCVILYLAALMSLTVPRSAAWLLPVVAVAALWALRPALPDLRQAITGSLAAQGLLAFALYALINATWSLAPGEAFAKVGLAIAYLLLVLAAVEALAQSDTATGRRLALALVLGAVGGALVFAFEVLSSQVLAKALHGLSNSVRRAPDIEDLNRNAGLLSLLFWPVLLAASGLSDTRRRYGLGALFLLPAVVGVASSSHETSMIALAGSTIIFAASLWRPAAARWTLIIVWIAAFALVLPTASLAYKADLHFAEWLPKSARARVVLWSQTAERVPQAPILGIGVRSTQAIHDKDGASAVAPPGFPYPLQPGRHAHNFYLQSWYELGLVGVILFAAAGLAVLWRLRGLPERAQAFAHAQYTAFMALIATSWDMWQSWLLAGIGLSVVAMSVALRAWRDA